MPLRVRTDQDLAAVLGQVEDDALDFKGDAWDDGEECAKDVAALGNAWGGQVLVGVTEQPGTSRASGFRDWLAGRSESVAQQQVQQWLEHSLRPRDFVDRLTYRWLKSPSAVNVLSLEVPPAAERCLAVAKEPQGQRKGTSFRFPVRTDKETRFMEYDEIRRRLEDPARATYLQLKELREAGATQKFVRIASPIVLLTSGGPRHLVRDPSKDYDASLGQQHAEGFTIAFLGTYHWGSTGLPENLAGRAVLIPYALVRTLWTDPRGVVCVALDGQIQVFGQQLQVTTG